MIELKLDLKLLEDVGYQFGKDNPLIDFSKKEVTQLLLDYYALLIPVEAVLQVHHLKMKASLFSQYLPQIDTLDVCPNDTCKMWTQLPSRSKKEKWLEDSICPMCGYTIKRNGKAKSLASTANLTQEQLNQQRLSNVAMKKSSAKQAAAAEHLAVETRKKIKSFLRKRRPEKVDFLNLTVQESLDIAVLLNQFHASSLSNIGTFDEHLDIHGDSLYDDELINRMLKADTLVFSEDSEVDSFVFDRDQVTSVYTTKVNWHIWVSSDYYSDELLLEQLKNPGSSVMMNKTEIDSIYLGIVKKEIYKIFAWELTEHKFSLNKANDKIEIQESIDSWLMSYTPAQIRAIIWRGVRMANNSRTKETWGNFKYHPIHFVIHEAKFYVGSTVDSNRVIPNYTYPKDIERNLETDIFFNQIIEVPDW